MLTSSPLVYLHYLYFRTLGISYSYSTVARDLWSITTPSPSDWALGLGVVIDHKSLATVLQLIYIPPDWIVHCHSYKNYY